MDEGALAAELAAAAAAGTHTGAGGLAPRAHWLEPGLRATSCRALAVQLVPEVFEQGAPAAAGAPAPTAAPGAGTAPPELLSSGNSSSSGVPNSTASDSRKAGGGGGSNTTSSGSGKRTASNGSSLLTQRGRPVPGDVAPGVPLALWRWVAGVGVGRGGRLAGGRWATLDTPSHPSAPSPTPFPPIQPSPSPSVYRWDSGVITRAQWEAVPTDLRGPAAQGGCPQCGPVLRFKLLGGRLHRHADNPPLGPAASESRGMGALVAWLVV